MRKYDIAITGIGGQGVITLGTLFKLAAIKEGVRVTGSEKRGGAQREGPVTAFVRYQVLAPGESLPPRKDYHSAQLPTGGADLLVSLEPLEAVRVSSCLNERSVVVLNSFARVPIPVRMGQAEYPTLARLEEMLGAFTEKVYSFNMDEISREAFGGVRQVNTICLGLAAGLGELPVSIGTLIEVIGENLPDFEENRRGFELGLERAQRVLKEKKN